MYRLTHMRVIGTSLVIAAALATPLGAHAGSGGAARAVAEQRAEGATQPGGLDRRDAALGIAFLVGALVMALRGDVVVGAGIGATTVILGTGARLVTGRPKRGPAWSEWPVPSSPRVAREGHRSQPRASERNLPRIARNGHTR
jgi:hypothetical protein